MDIPASTHKDPSLANTYEYPWVFDLRLGVTFGAQNTRVRIRVTHALYFRF